MALGTDDTVAPSLAEQVEELKSLVHAQKMVRTLHHSHANVGTSHDFQELIAQHNETKKLRESLCLRKLEAASERENEENNIFVAIDDGREPKVFKLEQQSGGMAPFWDHQDNIFRCTQCGWEVVWDECPCWSDYSKWDVNAVCTL